jgi:hypothetical protein
MATKRVHTPWGKVKSKVKKLPKPSYFSRKRK